MFYISQILVQALNLWILVLILVLFWCYRYLKEDKPHGSAGGLYNFRDLIMEDDPVFIFLPFFLILLLISKHGLLTSFFF